MKLFRSREQSPSLLSLSIERTDAKAKRLEFDSTLFEKSRLRRFLEKIFCRQKHKLRQ